MENTHDSYTSVFLRLQSFYILITIHDVEEYNLLQLQALAFRLEGQLALDPSLQALNDQLTANSDRNVHEKQLRKKEKKLKAAKAAQLEQSQKVLAELEETAINSSQENCWDSRYEVLHVLEGVLYDGRMYVKAEVARALSAPAGKMGFLVAGEVSRSVVTAQSLRELGVVAKKSVVLFVEGREQVFEVSEEGENVLGLDFLRSHRVMVSSNYRPDCPKCRLAFTA
jgi:hypothetical protein